MPSIDKKYYHNLDLDSNEIKAGRIYNLTTTQRNALSLSTTDKGYLVYDTTLLSLFIWDGTAWTSAGGGSQNLQQVTTAGNTTTNNIVLNSTNLYERSESAPYEEFRNYCGEILAQLFNTNLILGYDYSVFSDN